MSTNDSKNTRFVADDQFIVYDDYITISCAQLEFDVWKYNTNIFNIQRNVIWGAEHLISKTPMWNKKIERVSSFNYLRNQMS